MISGHGTNPIFFNKKKKIGRPEHLLTPHPLPLTPIKVVNDCKSCESHENDD